MGEPQPRSFYEDLFINHGTGGLNDYWMAASLGSINLDGSQVFGWKTFESTRDEFVAANPGRAQKIEAAKEQFDGVDWPAFLSVVALFAVDVADGGADFNGVLGQPGDTSVTWLAHETGHVFGLAHSFDHSDRVAMPTWPSAPGEYFDPYDVMSAMNVLGDAGHRFSPRGPLLNVANMDRMGWLPAHRVWQPATNSSNAYEIELVALEHPQVAGYLAAKAGGWIAEFRMREGFDGGLPRAAVLFHVEKADPNSFIIAADEPNHVFEWHPGQVFGNPTLFELSGGTRVTIVDIDPGRRKARLRIQVKAMRPPFIEPEIIFGLGIGQLSWRGRILVFRNGKIVPIPVPDPEPFALELLKLLRSHVADGPQTPQTRFGNGGENRPV